MGWCNIGFHHKSYHAPRSYKAEVTNELDFRCRLHWYGGVTVLLKVGLEWPYNTPPWQ
jgi:hypothetical protein